MSVKSTMALSNSFRSANSSAATEVGVDLVPRQDGCSRHSPTWHEPLSPLARHDRPRKAKAAVSRIESNRDIVVGNRFVELQLLSPEVAAHGVRRAAGRRETNDHVIIRNGLVDLPFCRRAMLRA